MKHYDDDRLYDRVVAEAIAEWRRESPEDTRDDEDPELIEEALDMCGPQCGCSDPDCPCGGPLYLF